MGLRIKVEGLLSTISSNEIHLTDWTKLANKSRRSNHPDLLVCSWFIGIIGILLEILLIVTFVPIEVFTARKT